MRILTLTAVLLVTGCATVDIGRPRFRDAPVSRPKIVWDAPATPAPDPYTGRAVPDPYAGRAPDPYARPRLPAVTVTPPAQEQFAWFVPSPSPWSGPLPRRAAPSAPPPPSNASYPIILWPIPPLASIKTDRDVLPIAQTRPAWVSNCDAAGCLGTISFYEGAGWEYVVGSLRVQNRGKNFLLRANPPPSQAEAEVDGIRVPFVCTETGSCKVDGKTAQRLALLMRTGQKMTLVLTIPPIETQLVGTDTSATSIGSRRERLRTIPPRVIRKDIDLTEAHTVL